MTTCRNCGYERKPQDDRLFSRSECPRCRVIYGKLSPKSAGQEPTAQSELKSTAPPKATAHRIFPPRLPIRSMGKHLVAYYLMFKSKPLWQKVTQRNALLLILAVLLIFTIGTSLIYYQKKGEEIRLREMRERELLREIAAREQEVRRQEEAHQEMMRQMQESHEEEISREVERVASLRDDLERQEELRREEVRRQEEIRKAESKRLEEARNEEIRREQAARSLAIMRENERLAQQYEMQQRWGHLLKIQQIVTDYHKTHTYSLPDYFVCSDMALDVWNRLKTEGINAKICVGRVDKDITDIYKEDVFGFVEQMNHAWLIAEMMPSKWIAIETTGGFVVSKDHDVPGAKRDPLYFYGFRFSNPREFKAFNECRSQLFKICYEADALKDRWNRTFAGTRKTYQTARIRGLVDAKAIECDQAEDKMLALLLNSGNIQK